VAVRAAAWRLLPNLNSARRWSIEQYPSLSVEELVPPQVSEATAFDPHRPGAGPVERAPRGRWQAAN